MNRKLWIVTIIYQLFVAMPCSFIPGIAMEEPMVGFLVWLGLTGLYTTALLLIIVLIDYARGKWGRDK
jgi:hypothetical protein